MEITCDFWGRRGVSRGRSGVSGSDDIACFTRVSRGRRAFRSSTSVTWSRTTPPAVPIPVVGARRQDSHDEHPHEQHRHQGAEHRDRRLHAVGAAREPGQGRRAVHAREGQHAPLMIGRDEHVGQRRGRHREGQPRSQGPSEVPGGLPARPNTKGKSQGLIHASSAKTGMESPRRCRRLARRRGSCPRARCPTDEAGRPATGHRQ